MFDIELLQLANFQRKIIWFKIFSNTFLFFQLTVVGITLVAEKIQKSRNAAMKDLMFASPWLPKPHRLSKFTQNIQSEFISGIQRLHKIYVLGKSVIK